MNLAERLQAIQPVSYAEARRRFDQRVAFAQSIESTSEFLPMVAEALDRKAIGSFWAGLLIEWAEALAANDSRWSVERALQIAIEYDLCFSDLVSDCPVLDVSDADWPPNVALALVRPDTKVVLLVGDAAIRSWLETTLAKLKIDNVIIAVGEIELVPFQEIICRDQRGIFETLRRSRRFMGLGGRWYLLRDKDPKMGADGLLVQTIEMGQTRWILHFVGIPEEAGVRDILATGKLLLDKIEEEMKRISFWDAAEGSFEYWLQQVFLVNAREAVEQDAWPESSNVAGMALRHYDYHSDVPEAGTLRDLLRAFDLLVEKRKRGEASPHDRQAVSLSGRLLTKSEWRDLKWFGVDVVPYDAKYFPKVIGHLAQDLGLSVSAGMDWDFLVDGVKVKARMEYRQSCSIATEDEATRDRIFESLQKTDA